jgi:hypothetical protein
VAHIEDRCENAVDGRRVRTERRGTGRRWRAHNLDPDGQQRSRTLARKLHAELVATTGQTQKLRGAYIDRDAGLEPPRAHITPAPRPRLRPCAQAAGGTRGCGAQ